MPSPSPLPHRLTWRVALLPALAALLVTVLLLACQQRLMGRDLIERSLARNQQRADVLGLQLQLSLRDAVSQVQLLARAPLLLAGLAPGADAARVRAELDHLVDRSPRFAWVGLVAPDGRVLAGSRGWLEGRSVAQRPGSQAGGSGRVGDLHNVASLAPLLAQLPGGAGELIDISEPVVNEAGEVVAFVTAHLGVQWVSEQLALSLGAPDASAAPGLQSLVLTAEGERSVLPGVAVPAGLPARINPARVWAGNDGQRWLLAHAGLSAGPGDTPLLPWRAVVLQSEDAALAPMHTLAAALLRVGLGTALVLAVAGVWAARRQPAPAADAVPAEPSPAALHATPPGKPAGDAAADATCREITRLNRHLLEQEKRTGRKLGQSLHDELGQSLAALRLHWEAYRGAAPEQRQRMDEPIANLIVLANRQVRSVLAELRPPLLDELGLAAAIDNEIRQHQGEVPTAGEARMLLEASSEAQLQRWPADVEYTAFMITREALLNAQRHAGAQTIRISLDGDEDFLQLQVADDGRGLTEADRAGGPGGIGLVAMRERALAVGARLAIEAVPGDGKHGTIVSMTWEHDDDEPHLPG